MAAAVSAERMSLSPPRTSRTGHRSASSAAHHAWPATRATSGGGRGVRPISGSNFRRHRPPGSRRTAHRIWVEDGLGRPPREPGVLLGRPGHGAGEVREPLRDGRRVRRHPRGAARIDVGTDVVQGEGAEARRRRAREGEPDEPAERRAQQVHGREAKPVEEREHVQDVPRDRVGSGRPAALAAAAEVGGQAAVTAREPGGDRVEGVALLGEPVEEEHRLGAGGVTRWPVLVV